MVIGLAANLELPLRDRNELLIAAGYAPEYRELAYEDPDLEPVRAAIDQVLAAQEPYPALVVDRQWELVAANRALGLMTEGVAPQLLEAPANAMRIALHPEGMAPRVLNFAEWRRHVLAPDRPPGAADRGSGDGRAARGAAPPSGRRRATPGEQIDHDVFIPLRMRGLDGEELSFFSTVATFGTAVDVTVAELSIESFFPADDAHRRRLPRLRAALIARRPALHPAGNRRRATPGVIDAATPASTIRNMQAHAPKNSALTMAVLMAGTFVFVLDFFIVNVAIPSTQAELGASDSQIQLVVATYAIAIASLLILGGRLGDLFGRRRLFTAGLALFTVSSALCGAAPGVGLLLVGRVLQGIGAALFAPQVLSIIGVTFDGEERRRAVTTYGLTMGMAAAGGQLIGGALIALDLFGLDWRACYLVNVPIGIAALLLAPRAIEESRAEGGERLDLLGAALAGRDPGRDRPAADRRPPRRLAALDLRLPRRRGPPGARLRRPPAPARRERRRAAGPPGALPRARLHRRRHRQRRLLRRDGLVLPRPGDLPAGGLRALGARLGPRLHRPAIGYLVASAGAEALAPRFGRQVLAAGGVVRATALAGLALTVSAIGIGGSPLLLVPALAVDGIGMGLLTAPLVATVVGGMDARHAGAASGVLSTAQQVGNTIGVAAIGAIFYGALGSAGDFAGAFELALVAIAAVCIAVAAIVQLLPGGRPAPTPTPEAERHDSPGMALHLD